MPRRRKHIGWKTKYAAALLALGDVPYEHAKMMSEDQIISLYQVDHGKLHAFDGEDEFWNLTPRLIADHREKSKRDKSITSKAARIDENNEEARRKLLARQNGERYEPVKPKRKIRNGRGFPPKGTRKMQSRGFEKRRAM